MDTKEKKRTASTKQNSKPSASAGRTRQSQSGAVKTSGQKKPSSATRQKAASAQQRTAAQTPRKTSGTQQRSAAAQPTRSRTQIGRTRETARKRPQETERRRTRPAESAKEKQAVPTPDVVYTPPKPFSRNRFLLHLASVVAVVLALTFGISIFFKVDTITVSGTQKYTPWIVSEASGIQIGDNLLNFGNAKACGRIKSTLPYVDSVRIGIKLPGTVNIEITELDVLYSIKDTQDGWWLITSDGKVVDQADNASAGDYTKVLGVRLFEPVANQQAIAADTADGEAAEGETSAPVTVRGSDRLLAAQSILQYLEENSILGEVASIDVSDLGNIELWYGTRYQILLGDTTRLDMKIERMKQAIAQRPDYDQGILDISYTVMPDKIIYKPFA